jgi:paraquat-inducible protein B
VDYRPNTRLIGAFIAAALVVTVGLVAFFGSASLFSRSARFVLFFDQSINGLNLGSAVKFRGVPVGAVERIMIRFEGQDPESSAIPVVIRVDQSRLEKDLGLPPEVFEREVLTRAIDRGLAAQLNLESFITGQLFVELSYVGENANLFRVALEGDPEILQIPTITSSMDQITADAAKLVADARDVDLKRLNDNVNQALENLAEVLAGIDSEGISRAVVAAAGRVEQTFGSEEFVSLMASLRETADQARATLASLDLADGPMAASVERNAVRLEAVLENFEALSASANTLVAPGSDLRYELENALRELGRAGRSLRELSDFIERNPRALLTGRPEEEVRP